jgi:hypothetical protein
MLYMISKDGKPLMPTNRHGKVRRLLKEGKAKVITLKPFTIQLLYQTTEFKQPISFGIDSGYQRIGFSAVTRKEELLSGEVHMLEGQSERIKERSSYRRLRRARLRYRKSKFSNRKRAEGRLAPSIEHKFNTHIRLVEKVSRFLPITNIVIEVAAFDIQKLKDSSIEAEGYQQGEQQGFSNLREYILHRDNHSCQNPNCTNKGKEKILQVHHLGYWKEDRTDRPSNLITLCERCHRAENHKEGSLLYGWQPKMNGFKPETFMSQVRWRLVNELECEHSYGFITKTKRVALKLEKSHVNDAFVIAGGEEQKRIEPIVIEEVRRNNRSLEKFYDAIYIDTRSGKKAKGQELNSGTRTRNRKLNGESLHKSRGVKLKAGRRRIRRKRYAIQPKDIIKYNGQKYQVSGIQNYGDYIKLTGIARPVRTSSVKLYRYGKGLNVL